MRLSLPGSGGDFHGKGVDVTVVQMVGCADPMADRPVRCEIEVLPDGVVTVLRSPGCTEADAVDLCRAIATGDVRVRDLTPRANVEAFRIDGE